MVMAYTIILITVGVISWGVGMWAFLRLGRLANVPYTGPAAAWRIYRYAFTEMRGSRETKVMVCGFVGMLLLPGILAFALMPMLPPTP